MICVEIGLCMQERTSSSIIIIIAQLIIASLVPLEKAWLREAPYLYVSDYTRSLEIKMQLQIRVALQSHAFSRGLFVICTCAYYKIICACSEHPPFSNPRNTTA